MKKLIIILVGIAVLGAGVWYLLQDNVSQDVPVGFIYFEDSEQGVAFEMPEDWKQASTPMSGEPAIVSPEYTFEDLQQTGAIITYHRYTTAGTVYEDRPTAEYFDFLVSEQSGSGYGPWSKITLDGREALLHTAGGYNAVNVISRDGDHVIQIRYSDETGEYADVFELFLKTFQTL